MFRVIEFAYQTKTKEIIYAAIFGVVMWIISIVLAITDQSWNAIGAAGSMIAGLFAAGAGVMAAMKYFQDRHMAHTRAIEKVDEMNSVIDSLRYEVVKLKDSQKDFIKEVRSVKDSQTTINMNHREIVRQHTEIKTENRVMIRELSEIKHILMKGSHSGD